MTPLLVVLALWLLSPAVLVGLCLPFVLRDRARGTGLFASAGAAGGRLRHVSVLP